MESPGYASIRDAGRAGRCSDVTVESITGWQRPAENTIEALRHGITHNDGIEFDLRLTTDGRLMLHHDNCLPDDVVESSGLNHWTEDNSSEELAEIGVASFAELLSDAVVIEAWREHAKVACVELKMPHPRTKNGGAVTAKKREDFAVRMAILADEMLHEVELPKGSAVLWSFKRNFKKSCNKAEVRIPVAQLKPHIPEYGSTTVKRIVALPSFMWLSLPLHMRMQKRAGAPMLPCALEYLSGWTRHITFGQTVGLSGYTGDRLTRLRKGYQAYVWPVPFSIERAVSDLGLTAVSDHSEPDIWSTPEGGVRWPRWASQPLDADWISTMNAASVDEHESLIKQATASLSHWHEMNDAERRDFLDSWRKRWQWGRSLDELCNDAAPERMPWEASRLIGHRGAGRTSGRKH